MDDLISRQAAIDAVWDGINMDIYTREVKEILEELPTVEPRKGRWIRLDYCTLHCNLCGATFMLMQGISKMKYCPNCIARMEG